MQESNFVSIKVRCSHCNVLLDNEIDVPVSFSEPSLPQSKSKSQQEFQNVDQSTLRDDFTKVHGCSYDFVQKMDQCVDVIISTGSLDNPNSPMVQGCKPGVTIGKWNQMCLSCLQHLNQRITGLYQESVLEGHTYLKVWGSLTESLCSEANTMQQSGSDIEGSLGETEEPVSNITDEEVLMVERLDQENKELERRIQKLKDCTQRIKDQISSGSPKKHAASYWIQWIDCDIKRTQLAEKSAHCRSQRDARQVQRNHLEQLDLYDHVFHIWHNEGIATMNGFRLGRTLKQPVPSEELNQSLGMVALLLNALCHRAGLDMHPWRLQPNGDRSFFIHTTSKQKLDLFEESGSSSSSFSSSVGALDVYGALRTLWYASTQRVSTLTSSSPPDDQGRSRRDEGEALGLLLDHTQRLVKWIQQHDPTFQPPYIMSSAREGTLQKQSRVNRNANDPGVLVTTEVVSLRDGRDQEQWTRACKYFLTNIKWILKWFHKHLVQ